MLRGRAPSPDRRRRAPSGTFSAGVAFGSGVRPRGSAPPSEKGIGGAGASGFVASMAADGTRVTESTFEPAAGRSGGLGVRGCRTTAWGVQTPGLSPGETYPGAAPGAQGNGGGASDMPRPACTGNAGESAASGRKGLARTMRALPGAGLGRRALTSEGDGNSPRRDATGDRPRDPGGVATGSMTLGRTGVRVRGVRAGDRPVRGVRARGTHLRGLAAAARSS